MIRMIEDADIPVILDWYNFYIEHSSATFETEPLSLETFTKRVHMITEKYPWIILEKEGKPVGYAYLGSFMERAAYDWTCDLALYLDPEQRGKGYGTELMNAIIETAEKCGYVNLVSIVTMGNRASEHLHEKAGFRVMGQFEHSGYKFDQWWGITWYGRCLKDQDEKPNPLSITL